MNQWPAISVWMLMTLAGCSTMGSHAGKSVPVGVDGVACVGEVAQTIPGLTAIDSEVLLDRAQLPSGKGGICSAKVFVVNAPKVLYRVFDAGNPYSKLGSWWALTPPTGSRESYREAYAICPEWSKLDRVVSCEVQPGTVLVIGNTQSVTCGDQHLLPKTQAIQVFVPNNGKAGITHTGACAEVTSTPWP